MGSTDDIAPVVLTIVVELGRSLIAQAVAIPVFVTGHSTLVESKRTTVVHIALEVEGLIVRVLGQIVVVHRGNYLLTADNDACLGSHGLSIGAGNLDLVAPCVFGLDGQRCLIAQTVIHLVGPLVGVRLIATFHGRGEGRLATSLDGCTRQVYSQRVNVAGSGELGLDDLALIAQCAHIEEVSLILGVLVQAIECGRCFLIGHHRLRCTSLQVLGTRSLARSSVTLLGIGGLDHLAVEFATDSPHGLDCCAILSDIGNLGIALGNFRSLLTEFHILVGADSRSLGIALHAIGIDGDEVDRHCTAQVALCAQVQVIVAQELSLLDGVGLAAHQRVERGDVGCIILDHDIARCVVEHIVQHLGLLDIVLAVEQSHTQTVCCEVLEQVVLQLHATVGSIITAIVVAVSSAAAHSHRIVINMDIAQLAVDLQTSSVVVRRIGDSD